MSHSGLVVLFLSSVVLACGQEFLISDQGQVQVPAWQETISRAYQSMGNGDFTVADKLMDQALAAAWSAGIHANGFVAAIQQVSGYYGGAGLEIKGNAILNRAIDLTIREKALEMRTQLECALANQYAAQGREMKALLLFRQILARIENQDGTESPELAGVLSQAAWAAERVGNLDEAEKWIKQASAVPTRPATPARASARFVSISGIQRFSGRLSGGLSPFQTPIPLAQFYERHRRFAEAEQIYVAAIEKSEKPTEAVFPLQMYSQFLRGRKRYQEAEAVQKRIINIHEAMPAEGGSSPAHWDRQNLAQLYLESKNYEAANKLIDEQVTVASRAPASTGEYFNALTMKVEALSQQKNYAAAEVAAVELLHAAEHGDQQYQKHWAYSKLSQLADESGDSKKAAHFRDLATDAAKPLESQSGMLDPMRSLAEAQSAANAGRVDDALKLSDAALSAIESTPNRAVACGSLYSATGAAQILLSQQKVAAADTIIRKVSEVAEQNCGDRPNNAGWYDAVTGYYIARGLPEEAKRAASQWAALITAAKGEDSPNLESVIRRRIDIARAEQDMSEVSAQEENLLKRSETNHGPDSQMTIQQKQTVAATRSSRGDFAGAEELWLAAVRGTERLWDGTGVYASVLGQVADFYVQTHRLDEARKYAANAIEVSNQSEDEGSSTQYYVDKLKEIDRLQKLEKHDNAEPELPVTQPAVASKWFDSTRFSSTVTGSSIRQ